MNHPIYRITSCEHIAPYSLHLRFDDGLTRTIDLESILEGELYGPLRDPAVFARSRSTRKFIPSSGRAAPTLTRLRCMIGRNTRRLFALRPSAGAALKRTPDMGIMPNDLRLRRRHP